MRFADDAAIIEELQDIVNRLVDTGRKYDMEINIGKPQVREHPGEMNHWVLK